MGKINVPNHQPDDDKLAESGFQIVRQPQQARNLAPMAGAKFMSWREATNGDIVLDCDQDEYKHI